MFIIVLLTDARARDLAETAQSDRREIIWHGQLNLQKGIFMNRTLLASIFFLISASVSAANWPWQDASAEGPSDYCVGLLVGGLASKQVTSISRTDLWLAWSYVIRSGALDQSAGIKEYRSGQDLFQNAPDASTAESILQEAQGDCGLGRTGHQVTGW